MAFIELPDLSVEVSFGKFFATVLDVVIGVLVAGVAVVVVALRVLLLIDIARGLGFGLSLRLKRDGIGHSGCDCDKRNCKAHF